VLYFECLGPKIFILPTIKFYIIKRFLNVLNRSITRVYTSGLSWLGCQFFGIELVEERAECQQEVSVDKNRKECDAVKDCGVDELSEIEKEYEQKRYDVEADCGQ
jgi:hypothetical protein